MMTIEKQLFALQDTAYRDFHSRLVPSAKADYIIGVRTPLLRRMAKEVDADLILSTLPHRYYEENQLHAFILNAMKDYGRCLSEVERFLPYIDNWATCDALRPKCFRSHPVDLQEHVVRWLADGHEYTVRFAIGVLEAYFLDERFDPGQLRWVASVSRDEYYVRMMQAWYFATALAKQWDATLPMVAMLPGWVRRKTIQKACESFRVPQAHKDMLRTMR